MNNALASEKVTQAAKADKRNRGPMERLSVEPMDLDNANAYQVSTHFEPKTHGKGNAPTSYPEPERKAFSSHTEAAQHIAKVLAEHAAQQGEDEK